MAIEGESRYGLIQARRFIQTHPAAITGSDSKQSGFFGSRFF
jgi:hypothetical protein